MDDTQFLEIHRFRINEFGKEKLGIYLQVVEEAKKQHPELVGAVVYGSQVTGRSKESSDVDSAILVDVSKAGLVDSPDAKMSDIEDENWEIVNKRVAEPLRSKLRERLGLDEEGASQKTIKLRLVSEARIVNDLNRMIEYVKAETERRARKEFTTYLEVPKCSVNYLFYLDLNGGLADYRKIALERLEVEGEVGDKVWRRFIVNYVQFGENGRLSGVNRTKNKLFPETVEEAKKKFGV